MSGRTQGEEAAQVPPLSQGVCEMRLMCIVAGALLLGGCVNVCVEGDLVHRGVHIDPSTNGVVCVPISISVPIDIPISGVGR